MITLTALWESSLLLCGIALLIVLALIFARLVSSRRRGSRETVRRELLESMLQGTLAKKKFSSLERKVAADLMIELSELVRGSDREAVLRAATAAGATRELRRRLYSPAAQDRLLAVEALALFPQEAERVARAAFVDHNPDVRLGAALALAQERRAPPAGELVRQLGIGTTEKSLLVISLMRDLVQADPSAVEALLYDPELPEAAKLAATDALAESGAVEHAPLVAWMAEASAGDPELQPRIYRALGRLGHPGGHNAILAGLQNDSWQVRSAASEAAGRSGLTAAAPRLAELLNDRQWWVRFRAGEALSRLGRVGRDRLHDTASTGSPTARRAASAIIAEKGLGR